MPLEHLDTVMAFVVVLLGVSLLITVLTQMMTNLLGLRGTNLKRGLVDLLKVVDPNLSAHAEEIAQQVLRHPLVSDSAFAKMPEWLKKIPVVRQWPLASAIRVEELVGVMDKLATPAAGAAPTPVQAAMAAFVTAARAEPSPAVAALAAQVRGLIPAPAAGTAATAAAGIPVALQLDKLAERLPAATGTALAGLKSWFDTAMDRTAQRFALHARLWTVVISIVFVFVAHFDALRVLTQISTDPKVRDALVGAADSVTAQGEKILAAPSGSSDAQTEESRKKRLKELTDQAEKLKATLGQTGFALVPSPYPGAKYTLREVGGILLAAALLSLGAPFWFNALKTLSNLRPILASKQEKEQAQKA